MSTAGKIFQLVPKVMKDVGAIGKGGFNQHDKYKFRTIDDMYNKLQPALAQNGVFFVPTVLESKEERVTSKAGTDMLRVKQKISYSIFADDGSSFTAVFEGEAIDRGDKATNKASTACFKYLLIQIFCIAVEDLPDADKESPETQSAPLPKVTAESVFFEEPELDNLGEFEIKIGQKHKGKKFKDMDLFQLDGYQKYFVDAATKNDKPLTGDFAEFVQKANEYLRQNEFVRK